MDIKNLTIKSAHESLMKGEFTAVELAKEYLKIIEEKNPDINAYLGVFEDVLKQAEEADKKIKSGEADLLTGIPMAIKDNILISGRTCSAASKILEHYKASYDATVIKKLKEKGVVFLGRTNMDEFAMGGSTENSAYGVTKNPHDLERVSGGSSGGSAAAVAMDGALVSLGSDTGGSVRQPSSFCGVVGLKPTYGRVSRYGLMAMASSLDQIGPIAKNVSDAEIVFNSIAGADIMDSTSYNREPQRNKEDPKDITIGIPRNFLKEGVDSDVLQNFEETISKFKKLGYKIKDIDLPNLKYSLAVYYILMPAEVSSNLARFDGIKYGLYKEGKDLIDDYFITRGEGFGRESRRRIILGTYVLSSGYYDAYYNKALIVQDLIRKDFAKAFNDVDIVLTPTSPVPSFKIGEKSNDPLSMYLADIFTVSANLAGVPAISIPSGFVKRENSSLPLGIQMMAPHFEENLLFSVGKNFEK
ncbi:MAG: Asp-tRNA(Asn)/Glu-tRNA(Gln) amidotransferase subunit GatA [Candidatus Paceibacterota bacterium]